MPIEEIADSVFGLLVRDVDDLGVAPGPPVLASGQSLSGLLLPSHGEIWVRAHEPGGGPAGGASPSATNSGTGACASASALREPRWAGGCTP